jgi:hemoglobin
MESPVHRFNMPLYTPPSGPPQGPGPSPLILESMGRDNLFALCAAFYRELEKTEIRKWFPADMAAASTKLAKFLSGVLGGPPLFAQEFGPPRMRQRHVPFPIDERAKNVWFHTFRDVLEARAEEFKLPREHLPGFLRWLEEFAGWMVNVKPGP